MHLRTTGVSNDRKIQKRLRKIIKRNVNVTNFDQVFDVLKTCIFFLLVNFLYGYHFVPRIYLYMISISLQLFTYCSLVFLNQSILI